MNMIIQAILFFKKKMVLVDVETSGGILFVEQKRLFGKNYILKKEWVKDSELKAKCYDF